MHGCYLCVFGALSIQIGCHMHEMYMNQVLKYHFAYSFSVVGLNLLYDIQKNWEQMFVYHLFLKVIRFTSSAQHFEFTKFFGKIEKAL